MEHNNHNQISAKVTRSTTVTGWTTAVAVNDVFAFNLHAVTGSTVINFGIVITRT